MRSRKRLSYMKNNQVSPPKSSNKNKKRKSKNFKNVKKFTQSRNKLRKNYRKSDLSMELSNRDQPSTSSQDNEEMVINQVRKLLGDDSIEEYTGYQEDNNLIQDLNLLMLSSSPEEYEVYCDLIRKEYSYLSDSSYNSMRLKIYNNLSRSNEENTSEDNSRSESSFHSSKIRITRSRIRKGRKKKSLLSPKINLKNLSIRKLKKELRLAASNSFKGRSIDKKSSSVTDDCVLIEIPREVIVIDDEAGGALDNDTEAEFDNASENTEAEFDNASENTSLDEPMTVIEDGKIPIIISENQNTNNNYDENSTNNATATNKVFLNDFVTIDCITNTSIDSNLVTVNQEDSNLTTISNSNLKTLSETVIQTNISANNSPKPNEIDNNDYLKIINDDITLDAESNSDSVIEILANSEYDTVNSSLSSGDSKLIKPPLYEISKSTLKVLGADNVNSFQNKTKRYNNIRTIKTLITQLETNKIVKDKPVPSDNFIPLTSDKIQLFSNLERKNQNRTHGTNQNNKLNNFVNANENKLTVPLPISVPNKRNWGSNWEIENENKQTVPKPISVPNRKNWGSNWEIENENKQTVPKPISVPNRKNWGSNWEVENSAKRTSKKIDNDVIEIDLDSDDESSIEKDESCIFVGEIASSSKALDFIPLSSGNESKSPRKAKRRNRRSKNSPHLLLNPFKRFRIDLENRKLLTMSTPKNKKPPTGEIEFTHSEKKKNEKYNSNTYNPNKDENMMKCEKRMVILDGSNIAFNHGNSNYFSSKGLEIAINFFVTKGHEVKAVVPQFRVNYNRSSDGEKLKELHRLGKIVFTPGKNLPDLKASSYDDRFTLQLALEFDAAIVSNDNYRDLINENPGFKKIIENRVITYTWCNDLFIVAKDPYGQRGPSLDLILNRNIEEQNIEKQTPETQNTEKKQ